jgi:uncharacterized delta-60 repeat protein
MNRTLRLSMRLCGAMLLWQGLAGAALAQANWMPDPGFSVSTYAVDNIISLPSGKVLINGPFSGVNGTPTEGVALLNTDGTVDASFQAPGLLNGRSVYSLAMQPDGKVLIGGDFDQLYGASPRNRIARLNVDGTLDATFDPGTGANDEVLRLALQSDGKVLIGGRFTEVGGVARNRIARLNANGTLDATFDPGTGTNGTPWHLALQPDGKVLIGGSFTEVNGVARNRIARLNANGTLDAAFNPGTGTNGAPLHLALQPDGKVLIGGEFTEVDGVARNRIARLNANGTLDTTFNPGAGADYIVNSVSVQPDGKVLIGGWFTQVGGEAHPRIARLMPAFTIGGTITGLTGAGLVLRNNGSGDLAVPAPAPAGPAPFVFAMPVAPGGAYDVTVLAQPAGQLCAVTANGQGNAAADVANVQIDCVEAPVAPGGPQAIPVDAPWALGLLAAALGVLGGHRKLRVNQKR